MDWSKERLGEPSDCDSGLTPSAGERGEKLGGSILEYSIGFFLVFIFK